MIFENNTPEVHCPKCHFLIEFPIPGSVLVEGVPFQHTCEACSYTYTISMKITKVFSTYESEDPVPSNTSAGVNDEHLHSS